MPDPIIKLRDVGLTYKTRTGLISVDRYQALSGIDLDVYQGETLGVIGANGSGKSTLLRVLARIYKPDSGSLEYAGIERIALLSLGLGFSPELSGMDNAIFGSMLLGASLREAKYKLDDIVEFSELGEFIHHPIKTYSSGMRSRLAFSVALKMETDVLLIDEVLSVGDAHFREKSEAALKRRIRSGQTAVLVSHSLTQIAELCARAALIVKGTLAFVGESEAAIREYKARIDW